LLKQNEDEMKKTALLMTGIVIGSGATLGVTQTSLFKMNANASVSETYRSLNLFGDIFERVRSDYVDQIDDKKLVTTAINGMLTGLDAHSSYLDPKSFKDMQSQTSGKFGGLGIEVSQEEGFIKVISPIDDTPASKGGVLSNDLITHIDNETVQGLTLQQSVEKMRGSVGSKILIRIKRVGQEKPVEITLVRDIILVRSVRTTIEDDIGTIRITSFNEQVKDNLAKGILEIQAKIPADKLKGYVLDLRNNPGGLLDQAIHVSDAFMERGEIVSTRSRRSNEAARYNAKAGDLINGKPLILLINGGSASASEIVAGALQDHKRATVIGTRSFGKGSVQTISPLPGDNGALRLTTARYFTPSGKSIQAKGIDPDIESLPNVPDELKGKVESKGEAGLTGHLKAQEGEERGASSVYVPPKKEDDVQLKLAFELLRGTQTNPAFPPNPKAAFNMVKPDEKKAEDKKVEEKKAEEKK
jgi:carboxyl-terminal processing protease